MYLYINKSTIQLEDNCILSSAGVNRRFYSCKLGKQIFATVKPRFTSTKLKIQYSYMYLHSNAILNIKCIPAYLWV